MKKIVSSFILLFLALSLCCSSQFVGLVSANFFPPQIPDHSIEITDDGAVTGTDKIQRSGNLYTFTENIVGSIVVFRSGIVIDGAGYTLQGNGTRTGIWFQAENNVEIKNLHIRNFTHGIEFTYALSLEGCTNITLSGDTITDNTYGITSWIFSRSNIFLGNTIANNTYGIYIDHCPKYVFRNNQLINNAHNLWLPCETSVQMTYYFNDIDTSNTINGKPIIYWVNEQNKTVPSDAGYVALVNCTNITVQNQNISNNGQGILLVATNNSLITKNQVANSDYGIMLYAPYEQCVGNIITGNNITSSTKDGIHSWNSEGTIITGNRITNNQENGINFYESPNTYIVGNAITGNKEYGIKLWSGSTNATIYHNNFVDNIKHGIVLNSNPVYWNNGTEGNYWNEYTGTDADGDGIGDTPYSNIYGIKDSCPLMEPYDISEHEILGVIPEFPDTTPPTISVLSPENKTYTVTDVPLTFTVSEATSWIGYSLDGQANVTITGNTTLTGLSDGSHSLTVYATDAAGNTGTSETIYFTIAQKTEPQQSEPFPTLIVAAIVIIAVVGVVLLVYFTKYKKTTGKAEK